MLCCIGYIGYIGYIGHTLYWCGRRYLNITTPLEYQAAKAANAANAKLSNIRHSVVPRLLKNMKIVEKRWKMLSGHRTRKSLCP